MNIMIHHIFFPYLVDRTAFGPERRRRRGAAHLACFFMNRSAKVKVSQVDDSEVLILVWLLGGIPLAKTLS